MRETKWARLLAYITGLVNQRLLLQCEYLIAENRILRSHLSGRLRLSDPERSTLAEVAKRLGRKQLAEVACVARPETILAWYRRLIARKFDGSKHRAHPGRPCIDPVIEALVVRMAQENSSWGYDRIAGALANLGHHVSGQTIGNILRRHGIAPAPKRSQNTTWKEFIAAHMAVLAGTDFFTVEVLTWHGLATTTSCSSCTWRLDALPSPASLDTPQKPGSPKWRATLLTTLVVVYGSAVTCYMTATPNFAALSMRSWLQKGSAV